MAGDKDLFAPLPLRAMASDLSGLQLRTLTCVAAHDRLSLVTGKGQGCRASNERMRAMIGCSFARLCSTLSQLVELGFLRREKLGRHTVYRVIYTDADRLLFGNVSPTTTGCRSASQNPLIGCQAVPESGEKQPETGSQYIPLNGGIDSEESGEENPVETARFAARRLSRSEFADNAGGQLARLERELNAGASISEDAADVWGQYLGSVAEADDCEANRYRAERLIERLTDALAVQRNGRTRPKAAHHQG